MMNAAKQAPTPQLLHTENVDFMVGNKEEPASQTEILQNLQVKSGLPIIYAGYTIILLVLVDLFLIGIMGLVALFCLYLGIESIVELISGQPLDSSSANGLCLLSVFFIVVYVLFSISKDLTRKLNYSKTTEQNRQRYRDAITHGETTEALITYIDYEGNYGRVISYEYQRDQQAVTDRYYFADFKFEHNLMVGDRIYIRHHHNTSFIL